MEPKKSFYDNLNKVTTFSRRFAIALFVVLPFVGFYMGYQYAPTKVVETEKIIKIPETQSSDILVERPSFIEKDTSLNTSIYTSCVPENNSSKVYTKPNVESADDSLKFSGLKNANFSATVKQYVDTEFMLADIYDGRGLVFEDVYLRRYDWSCSIHGIRTSGTKDTILNEISTDSYSFRYTSNKLEILNKQNEIIQSTAFSDLYNNRSDLFDIYGVYDDGDVIGMFNYLLERMSDTPLILSGLDINQDGYSDLGVLVDTGPLEPGYVFYLFDPNTNKFVPTRFIQDSKVVESYVVYYPTINEEDNVLNGRFTVTSPSRNEYYRYVYNDKLKALIEEERL